MQAPRKSLGQHFLQDPIAIQEMIAAFQIKPGDHLVEIGPGLGALTQQLSHYKNPLDLIEIDQTLAEQLQQTYRQQPHITVHATDALIVSLKALATDNVRLIGNLPYRISTPLLFHYFEQIDDIDDMLFMLQKEVVDRMIASPGTKAYGRLSVMTQYFCDVAYLFTLPPEAFFPPPKVYSAVVYLKPHHRFSTTHAKQVSRLVQQAFNQRRKTMHNALKKDKTLAQFAQCQIDPKKRPEQLTVEDFYCLATTD